jgi:hypothetical protein
MNMRFGPTRFIAACLLLHVSGCKETHLRPSTVPSTATWVDHAFIDCSVETKSRANRCTVYGDNSGEILADGLFLLDKQLAEAETSELRYAAFGNGMIYLQDARVLVQWVASERDPSTRIVKGRLKALAGIGAAEAIDCNATRTNGTADDGVRCGMRAFAARKPFYLRYYQQRYDSFGFTGLAGDEDGNAYEVDYNSRPLTEPPLLPKDAQLLDDNHTVVVPCRHKPITLEQRANGSVVCQVPLGW